MEVHSNYFKKEGVILEIHVELNSEQSLVEIIGDSGLKNKAISQGSCHGKVVLDSQWILEAL